MNATSDVGPARDFSDAAIWRGSLAAIVAGYLLWVLSIAVWSAVNLGWFDLQSFLMSLRFSFEAPALVVGVCGLGVAVVIGYFVMAAYKGDHTTYVAAMIIGARTAGVAFAAIFFVMLIANLGSVLVSGGAAASSLPDFFMQSAAVCAYMLAIGAGAGLAARIAAGAPTIERSVPEVAASAS
jgi:hypothetical protein